MDEYLLIGADISYYTGKVRSYLRYKGIPFREITASAEVYAKTIVPKTGVRFIPVLVTPDDEAVQDTTEIIDFLEKRFPEPGIYPETPIQHLVALLFEIYGDEWMVIPAMHFRWTYDESAHQLIREFGEVSMPGATPELQRRVGEQASAFFRKAPAALGVSEETIPAIEEWTMELLGRLNAHFSEQDFLLGTRPSIGDFGLMGPLYAHLYRDPVSGRIMKEHAPEVCAWVERMNSPVPNSGKFLAEDEAPRTLRPILKRMFAEQVPVIADTAARLQQWLCEHSDTDEIKRTIGTHRFRIGGAHGTRRIYPYTLWMWQRAVDYYTSLDKAARANVDAWFSGIDTEHALGVPLPARVKRVDNRLVAER